MLAAHGRGIAASRFLWGKVSGQKGHLMREKACVHPLTGGAVEVEEAARGKVHPLLALAVVVQGDLLRLHGKGLGFACQPAPQPSTVQQRDFCSLPCLCSYGTLVSCGAFQGV